MNRCTRSLMRMGAVLIAATALATGEAAGQAIYTSLPLPVPDNRPDDQTAAVVAEKSFLATLPSYGTETYDEITGAGLGFTNSQALTFGASGITGTAEFSGVFQIPALPTIISTPSALVEQPSVPQHPAPYNNDITLSQPVTSFGSYFIQAGDQAADTLTLQLDNTILGTTQDVVMGTVGPDANFNNVFYFGVTDINPFNRITLLLTNSNDGILLDNTTVGNVLPGDANFDRIVNGQDIALVASHWLQTGPPTADPPGDANFDGIVNGQDIALIASHWLQTSGASAAAVPEPASLVPAGMALVMVAFAGLRRWVR
jgi:hypothetical protein